LVRISFHYLERKEVSSCRLRSNGALFFLEATPQEVMELSSRKKLSCLTTNILRGSSLLGLEHEVDEFPFLLKVFFV